MVIKNVKIRAGKGRITAVVYKPKKRVRQVVILSHGFGGDDDGPSGLFIVLAKKLYAKGYGVIRYNFQKGGSEGTFDTGELFHDLKTVIKYARRYADKVILLGHSLGGLVSVLVASERKDIQAVVLWSPPLAMHVPKYKQQFMRKYNISFWRAAYMLGRYLFMRQTLQIVSFFRRINAPVLLVYGDADQFSEYGDMAVLRRFPHVELMNIDGLDHYYANFKKEIVRRTVQWIEAHSA